MFVQRKTPGAREIAESLSHWRVTMRMRVTLRKMATSLEMRKAEVLHGLWCWRLFCYQRTRDLDRLINTSEILNIYMEKTIQMSFFFFLSCPFQDDTWISSSNSLPPCQTLKLGRQMLLDEKKHRCPGGELGVVDWASSVHQNFSLFFHVHTCLRLRLISEKGLFEGSDLESTLWLWNSPTCGKRLQGLQDNIAFLQCTETKRFSLSFFASHEAAWCRAGWDAKSRADWILHGHSHSYSKTVEAQCPMLWHANLQRFFWCRTHTCKSTVTHWPVPASKRKTGQMAFHKMCGAWDWWLKNGKGLDSSLLLRCSWFWGL